MCASVLVCGIVGQAQAQFGSRNNIFIGFEATSTSRSFKMASDLTNVVGPLTAHGKKYGIVVGTPAFLGKLRIAQYNPIGTESPIKVGGYELVTQLNIARAMGYKKHLIEPYFTLSLEGTSLAIRGLYTPPPTASTTATTTCTCTCPNATPPAPPAPTLPTAFSGNVSTTRGNLGAGLKMHLEQNHLFFDFFAEAKYGIAIVNTASTEALLNTYSLSQRGFDLGVTIGWMRKKTAASRVYRTRFR